MQTAVPVECSVNCQVPNGVLVEGPPGVLGAS